MIWIGKNLLVITNAALLILFKFDIHRQIKDYHFTAKIRQTLKLVFVIISGYGLVSATHLRKV